MTWGGKERLWNRDLLTTLNFRAILIGLRNGLTLLEKPITVRSHVVYSNTFADLICVPMLQ